MAQTTETPLMRQYEEIKKKHPDALLLFRVGDFYELFSEDAVTASEILGITLTRRMNGRDKYIELAGFPHHALDSYLPKLVRAGKRVAICEQLGDGKPTVQRGGETSTEEPKPEPINKTEKKMETKNTIKQINCNLTDEQLRELGEPDAYFRATIPMECKTWGKQTDDIRPILNNICIEPGNGKIIVTNTHILHMLDIECDGMWPQGDKPFQCFIDPKAISAFAGKETDIAVWTQGRKVTACEAAGALTQSEVRNRDIYPDYARLIPAEQGCNINIHPDELKRLREFVKANMGKTKQERKNRYAVIHAAKNDADTLQVRIVEHDYEKYPDTDGINELASEQFRLSENATHYAQVVFNAELFYYAVQEDFNGQMWIPDVAKAVKFLGEMRRTILMPMQINGIEQYVKSEN